MKHLVTGGSGFLGNLIARQLFAQGEDVRILDIWEDSTRPPEIQYVACDIRDRTKVSSNLKGIDIVHHTAALVPLTKSGQEFKEVNIEGSRIVAEEAVKNGVKSFIHMSSSAIYGSPKDNPITLQTELNPVEVYGQSKLAGEACVRDVCRKGKLPLFVVRPRTIIGEGRLGIFQILFQWIKEGRRIYIIGSGKNAFQFIHASDLIDAYMMILKLNRPGSYNVGAPEYGTLREAIEHLIVHAGTKSKIVELPVKLTVGILQTLDALRLSPLAPWHYLSYHKPFCFDVSNLLEMGWKPKYSNDAMLSECYDGFCRDGSNAGNQSKRSAHRTPVKEKLLGWLRIFS